MLGKKKLYFSPLMDLANREVIAYNFATRPKFSLVKKMLEQGLVGLNRQNARLFIATKAYCMARRNGGKMLEGKAVQSMSRRRKLLR